MEFEGFKSVWQKQYLEGYTLPSPIRVSRPLQFLRTSAIRDLQRSDELSRFIFSFLFAFEPFGRMAIVTAFLAVAWRRATSHSGEIRSELKRYLKDLER